MKSEYKSGVKLYTFGVLHLDIYLLEKCKMQKKINEINPETQKFLKQIKIDEKWVQQTNLTIKKKFLGFKFY